MSVESSDVLGVSGSNLDKKGHGFVMIAKSRGLEKVFLIQLKTIN